VRLASVRKGVRSRSAGVKWSLGRVSNEVALAPQNPRANLLRWVFSHPVRVPLICADDLAQVITVLEECRGKRADVKPGGASPKLMRGGRRCGVAPAWMPSFG